MIKVRLLCKAIFVRIKAAGLGKVRDRTYMQFVLTIGWSWDKDGKPKGSGTVGHSTGSTPCKNNHPLKTEKSLRMERIFIYRTCSFR